MTAAPFFLLLGVLLNFSSHQGEDILVVMGSPLLLLSEPLCSVVFSAGTRFSWSSGTLAWPSTFRSRGKRERAQTARLVLRDRRVSARLQPNARGYIKRERRTSVEYTSLSV